MRTLTLFLLLLAAGCSRHTTGLSPREGAGTEYTAYLFNLYQDPATATAPAPQLTLPIHLAVAQVGEVAPPLSMLDPLRAQPSLFPRVEAIPGNPPPAACRYGERETPEQIRNRIDLVRRFARDLGMTHLFLYGGTIDHGTEKTPLGLLDLTVVGAYVVPSRKVSAVARASGALIDLNTGRVLFLTNAESERSTLAAKMSDQSANEKVVGKIRDDVITKLATNLIADTLRHPRVAAATPPASQWIAPLQTTPSTQSPTYYSTR